MKKFLVIFFSLAVYFQVGYVKGCGFEGRVYAEEIKTSDIRLEIVSEISILEEDLKKLKRKMELTDNPQEKKLLKNKVEAIEEKIKVLKKQLENYNQHINNIS